MKTRKEIDKSYYWRNREKVRAKKKAWHAANGERIRAYRREQYAKNRERELAVQRAWYARNNNGVTRARKMRGLPEPTRPIPSTCECCGRVPKHFCLDHDHETGAFRGWLCSPCNRAIGQLGDNIRGLMRAVKYLQRAELL